jgi:hypothetical protein
MSSVTYWVRRLLPWLLHSRYALVLVRPPTGVAAAGTSDRDEAAATAVPIVVYDVIGREVTRFVDGAVDAGQHSAVLEGGSLASGTYVVRLSASDGSGERTRLTLLR